MKTDWTSFIAYMVTVVCASVLTYYGKLPPEFLGALIGVAIPRPWRKE